MDFDNVEEAVFGGHVSRGRDFEPDNAVLDSLALTSSAGPTHGFLLILNLNITSGRQSRIS